jgi:hypothetical protein
VPDERGFVRMMSWVGVYSAALAGAVALIAASTPLARADDARVTARPAIAPLVSLHAVDMRTAPQAPLTQIESIVRAPSFAPLLVGTDAATWRMRKAFARDSRTAPYDPRPLRSATLLGSGTPPALTQFSGMQNSRSICPYYGGCQPPDAALAASSSWVVEGVNTSFAVYDTSGVLQTGWPKTAQSLFNVPNPGSCDPNGPFLENPRAFYDPTDGRFWVAIAQVEGAFGINFCPEQSVYWVAVSQTSNPTGAWNVYAFNMRQGTTNVADFTQTGLDGQAVYFGGNMFDLTGSIFQYDEIFAASKALMEAGMPVVAHGLKNIAFGTTMLDTVQPVLVEGSSPPAGVFVASLNIDSGGGNCVLGCSGIHVFAMSNPLTQPAFTHRSASSMTYTLAPPADQPQCLACIETFDTRISATPVYSGGVITYALETAVANGSTIVPGVMWGQVKVRFAGQNIASASTTQNAVLSFGGDQAASFGAVMPDPANDIFMVFDTMSATLNPGIEYVGRLSADPPGKFESPVFVKRGMANTIDSFWGAYGATSFDAASGDVWIAAEYAGHNGDWSTYVAATHF